MRLICFLLIPISDEVQKPTLCKFSTQIDGINNSPLTFNLSHVALCLSDAAGGLVISHPVSNAVTFTVNCTKRVDAVTRRSIARWHYLWILLQMKAEIITLLGEE